MYVKHQFPFDDVVSSAETLAVLHDLLVVLAVHEICYVVNWFLNYSPLFYAASGADSRRLSDCRDQLKGNLPFKLRYRPGSLQQPEFLPTPELLSAVKGFTINGDLLAVVFTHG